MNCINGCHLFFAQLYFLRKCQVWNLLWQSLHAKRCLPYGRLHLYSWSGLMQLGWPRQGGHDCPERTVLSRVFKIKPLQLQTENTEGSLQLNTATLDCKQLQRLTTPPRWPRSLCSTICVYCLQINHKLKLCFELDRLQGLTKEKKITLTSTTHANGNTSKFKWRIFTI